MIILLQSVTAGDVRSSPAAPTSQRTFPAQHVPPHTSRPTLSSQSTSVHPVLSTQSTPGPVTTPSTDPASPVNTPRCFISTRLPSCSRGLSIPAHSLTRKQPHRLLASSWEENIFYDLGVWTNKKFASYHELRQDFFIFYIGQP